MKFFLVLLVLVTACNRITPTKTTATASKTLSLSGLGSLSAKLEIRESGSTSLAVAWFTWSGTDIVSVSSNVALFRFDTNKLAELQSTQSDFDLDPDASKAISTPTDVETRRRCATLTILLTGFNSGGDEKIASGNAQVCEKD